MKIWWTRVSLLLLISLASTLASVAQPAWACGCGAVVSNDPLHVDGEASIVRWDDQSEQIVMRLAVNSQATDAAWIFPTPTPATVRLGHREWFRQIDALTRPATRVERDWWRDWNRRPRWSIFSAFQAVGSSWA